LVFWSIAASGFRSGERRGWTAGRVFPREIWLRETFFTDACGQMLICLHGILAGIPLLR